ncbi:MAG TPA: glutathione peroxidase [Armatimonadota bacterium]|jgi:glutathione peroxidase
MQNVFRAAGAFVVVMALLAAGMSPARTARNASPLLDRTMKDIDGKPVNLSRYKGKVLLFVNTASLCGNTPQYAGLEKVYREYKAKGLVVLGFPANNFGAQEPGSNGEIKQFCTSHYAVSFPMFSKISVKGPDQDPLYAYLTSSKTDPKFAGDVEWNFAKFLVNRKGEVVARFPAGHAPTEPDVIAAIEKALAEK